MTIEFESFITDYHQNLLAACLEADLMNFLHRELWPQVTIPFDSANGSLKPVYNENRYCDETSAVRNLFFLEFRFIYQNQAEYVKAELKYFPQKRDFIVRDNKPLSLWTIVRQQMRDLHKSQINEICDLVLTDKIKKAGCPVCQREIFIRFRPAFEKRAVACLNGCFSYNVQRNQMSFDEEKLSKKR